MYITTKKKNKQFNVIDNLFEVGATELVNYTNEPTYDFYRTVTKEVDEMQVTTDFISLDHIKRFCDMANQLFKAHPDTSTEYDEFSIPKKTHGFRIINAPKPILKTHMKQVSNLLTNTLGILPHDSAWAYVPGRDVVKAMNEHIMNESRWFLKLDLHDFFGSCSKDFIKTQLFKIYPFALHDTDMELIETINNLAEFATLNNGLPQGTPLSPVLTNLIMVEFDYKINRKLYELTKENKLYKQTYVYTRYADDIIISGKYDFDYHVIVHMIEGLLKDTPLELNKEKTRYGSNAGRNWNLGIMYNKDNKLTVGYRKKQQLKTVIHNYIIDDNLWSLEDLRWLLGQLAWLRNVEPEYFEGLMNYYVRKNNIRVWHKIINDIKRYNP